MRNSIRKGDIGTESIKTKNDFGLETLKQKPEKRFNFYSRIKPVDEESILNFPIGIPGCDLNTTFWSGVRRADKIENLFVMNRTRKHKRGKAYKFFRILRSTDDVDKGDEDTPLEDIPSSTTEATSEEKPSVKRQLSFAVSETLGEDVVFRRFLATEGILCFWKNFAYEDHGRPFLRAAHDANMEYIANVLHQQWKIKSPRIVLVVVSNIAHLHTWTNKRQLEHFQAGLIKAANTTEMWIFTPGANIGITKVIGDAVHNELLRRQALLCHKHPNQSVTYYLL
ncbi:transient receptor potential cation channel subfamily M member 6 [Trichonephila inaurata madagascariensis]|uniref:Transient receptor potential cation channel subfamily M member 6 n=1 Tax=Trichonephila inaurata madagascariensis TaxID=2747483 RepID=A0A8X6YGP8_9ARAC|nr:transient receptor potential cation channel subfamily M member 6 [Trichonephila inaurata madagascariensis]